MNLIPRGQRSDLYPDSPFRRAFLLQALHAPCVNMGNPDTQAPDTSRLALRWHDLTDHTWTKILGLETLKQEATKAERLFGT